MTKSPQVPEKSRAAHPGKTRIWLLLGAFALVSIVAGLWLFRRPTEIRDESAELTLKNAQSLWSEGHHDAAKGSLAYLARTKHRVTLHERLLRAEVARAEGRLDDAVAALDGVSGADPNAAVAYQARGLLEFARDRAAPSEKALLRALDKNPKLLEARRGLVDLYAIEGRKHDLAAQFSILAKSSVLTFDDLYLWCLGRRQDAGPAEFAAKLEPMLRNEPGDRNLRLALAENERRMGRLEAAEQSLAPLDPDDPDARAARARLAIDRGEAQVAERLLASGPVDHPGLARLRGRLALGRGDRAAVGHFRAAFACDPDDRDTLFGLGQALRSSGRIDEAAPFLEAARARDHLDWLIENARASLVHDDAKVLGAIADACLSLHRLPEAQGWFRLALARDPLAADIQKRLFDLDAKLFREEQVHSVSSPGK